MAAADTNPAEEHSAWRDNTPYLYNFVATHVLEWPSLTVEWLPGLETVDKKEKVQKLLLGTHSTPGESNYVVVLEARLPSEPVDAEDRVFSVHGDYAGFGYGKTSRKFSVRHRVPTGCEPNRVTAMPLNSHIVSAITADGAVSVFDYTKFDEEGIGLSDSTTRLGSHEREGWALGWSPMRAGRFASGADDMCVCIWDSDWGESSTPLQTLRHHEGPVQDLQWHNVHDCVLASVADDGRLIIWDGRTPSPQHVVQASEEALNCVSISPFRSSLVATAGTSQDISLWDIRNLEVSLHHMSGHSQTITRLLFNPNCENLLASASSDRRAIVWDMSRIGMEQRAEDATDGPPELLFMHSGHLGGLASFAWNVEEEYRHLVASCSDDNQIHIWELSPSVLLDDNEIIPEDEDTFEVE